MRSSSPAVLVNGSTQDSLPVTDRGLAYGHGLFETIRVKQGVPLLWTEHLERMREGCKRLRIDWSKAMGTLLAADADRLCAGSDAMLKLIITAGSGGLGYRLPSEQKPLRIVACYPLPDYPDTYQSQGITLYTCRQRLAIQPVLAGIKHLNRLEQVLASGEWQNAGAQEGVMLDQRDYVIEGTRTNLFAVDQQQLLITPDLRDCGIEGVMRRYLLQQASALGIVTCVGRYRVEEFRELPELFVCNSLIGIWPVTAWDNRDYRPGPITAKLQQKVKELFGEA